MDKKQILIIVIKVLIYSLTLIGGLFGVTALTSCTSFYGGVSSEIIVARPEETTPWEEVQEVKAKIPSKKSQETTNTLITIFRISFLSISKNFKNKLIQLIQNLQIQVLFDNCQALLDYHYNHKQKLTFEQSHDEGIKYLIKPNVRQQKEVTFSYLNI